MAKKRECDGVSVIFFLKTGPTRHSASRGSHMAYEEARSFIREIPPTLLREYSVEPADIEAQIREVCEHCGYEWSGDGDRYNDGCCQKDEDEHSAFMCEQAGTRP